MQLKRLPSQVGEKNVEMEERSIIELDLSSGPYKSIPMESG